VRNRLVLLIGDFSDSERESAALLAEWSSAGLLGTVAWTSVGSKNPANPTTSLSEQGSIQEVPLFELLTSRIWSQVSVIGIRQAVLASLTDERYESEAELLKLVQDAFLAHKELEFQSFTVSIAETRGLVHQAFLPLWNVHILHEPIVRTDRAVASQPMQDEHRHQLVLLLALSQAGGFIWQVGALAPEMIDPIAETHRAVRVGRAYLRVVSAGRLTDEVLAGAFPKSGPWSIPTDVPHALAVPPGTSVPDSLISNLVSRGRFGFKPWTEPGRERAKNLNIWEGLKLFAREFGAALRSIPVSLVDKVKRDVEDFVQKVTFGENANVLLRFDPRKDDLNSGDALEVIKNLQLGATVDPIGDADPWEVLQRVSLGAVDGGRFPDGVAPPASGSNRLIYTDPVSIGPAPDDPAFQVTPFEIALLNLKDSQHLIGPMAVADAITLKTHLEASRLELAVKPVEPSVRREDSGAAGKSSASKAPVKTTKKLGRFRRWRLRRKERRDSRKAARRLKRQLKKNPQTELSTSVSNLGLDTKKGELLVPGQPGGVVSAPQNDPNSLHVSAGTATQSVASEALTTPQGTESQEDESNRHSPSHPRFDSREYTPIGVFYQGSRPELLEEYSEANRIYASASASYASVGGRYSSDKTCDHCGTSFDHGFVYLHEPSKKLVHVGNVCARKTLPVPADVDLIATRLADLEKRFAEWLGRRSTSLLWRVGDAIVTGLVVARRDLAKCLEVLAARPVLEGASTEARIKFGKWTRRGVLSVVLVIAAALASVILTPIPLLLAVLIVTIYFSGFIIRMIFMARDIVRAQYKLRLALDEHERSYLRARHDVEEVVRLSAVGDQFHDWQIVIRELVHLPFGKEIGFATARIGIDEVTRPPAMVLGKSRPDEKQKMQLFLQARRQTIHAGWLVEILDILKDEWKNDYQNARLTTPADNILPEADLAPSGSVVGKRPLSENDVYYPRTDFRSRVTAGDLQRELVARKAEQVAVDLRQTALGRLLARVEVTGLGAALSGQTVEEFLAGLALDAEDRVAFPADLISDKYPSYRLFEPQITLPAPGTLNAESGQIQVEPGVELTAAAWRVELSAPLDPLEILRGFEEKNDGPFEKLTNDAPSPV